MNVILNALYRGSFLLLFLIGWQPAVFASVDDAQSIVDASTVLAAIWLVVAPSDTTTPLLASWR